MDPIIPNSQQLLAHHFFIHDMQVNKWSHQTILAIRRLNWLNKLPDPPAGKAGKSETEFVLKQSCFSIVPNRYLLLGEMPVLN
ncbi:MAG TPA: hypothetical protein VM012_12725 [Flavitalea sp.]|nr:hypothetical protein [Flavitalea sp.]